MSGTGPEVLFRLNERPERGSIPTFYFLPERTYLRHQTHYSLFLVKTKYRTLLQTSRSTVLGFFQVKAHDIRAFEASKAFYGRVSVDRIMQACHWNANNTFTNFYLKDLTWSDNDNNMYLGPVAVAQQFLDPSPQTSHRRKERKGAHPLQPSLKESKSQHLGIRLPPQDVW